MAHTGGGKSGTHWPARRKEWHRVGEGDEIFSPFFLCIFFSLQPIKDCVLCVMWLVSVCVCVRETLLREN